MGLKSSTDQGCQVAINYLSGFRLPLRYHFDLYFSNLKISRRQAGYGRQECIDRTRHWVE